MARKQRRVEEEEHSSGMERWLLTYADMITLLLALFVVLFSLSSISVVKYSQVANSLRAALDGRPTVATGGTGLLHQSTLVNHVGVVTGRIDTPQAPTTPGPPTGPAPTSTQSATPAGSSATSNAQPVTQIEQQLEIALGGQNDQGNVSLSVEARGLVVQILTDKAFFATDVATLGPEGVQIVDIIASVVRTDANNIAVEGYTDNQAITGGPYQSNWDLSAARAANVVERLNVTDGLDPNRLSAVGFGETRPIATNATPTGQQLNRRIDVVILNPGVEQE